MSVSRRSGRNIPSGQEGNPAPVPISASEAPSAGSPSDKKGYTLS